MGLFCSLDNLVEQYIIQRDFIKFTAHDSINILLNSSEKHTKNTCKRIALNRFTTLLEDDILQKIILWELSESKDFLINLANQREAVGEELFKRVAIHFNNDTLKLRAIMDLLIGGIYYLALHGKINGSLFCGLDVNIEKDKQLIEKTIEDIIAFAFEQHKMV